MKCFAISLSVLIILLAGNGHAQDSLFAPAVNYGVGDTPEFVFASDLDGDGHNDLVTANYYSGNVSRY